MDSVHGPGALVSCDHILYVLLDQINGHNVLCPPRYDHVCILLGWNTKLFKCWLHQGGVLMKNMLQVSASVFNISHDSSRMRRLINPVIVLSQTWPV